MEEICKIQRYNVQRDPQFLAKLLSRVSVSSCIKMDRVVTIAPVFDRRKVIIFMKGKQKEMYSLRNYDGEKSVLTVEMSTTAARSSRVYVVNDYKSAKRA